MRAVINAAGKPQRWNHRNQASKRGLQSQMDKVKNIEHFGFRDGVSQPLVIGIDTKIKEKDDLFEATNFVSRVQMMIG